MRREVAAVRSLSWSSLSLSLPNSQLNPEKAFWNKNAETSPYWFQISACSCLQCYQPSLTDSRRIPQTSKPNCLHEHQSVPRRWTLFTWVAGISCCSASKLFHIPTSLSVQNSFTFLTSTYFFPPDFEKRIHSRSFFPNPNPPSFFVVCFTVSIFF